MESFQLHWLWSMVHLEEILPEESYVLTRNLSWLQYQQVWIFAGPYQILVVKALEVRHYFED